MSSDIYNFSKELIYFFNYSFFILSSQTKGLFAVDIRISDIQKTLYISFPQAYGPTPLHMYIYIYVYMYIQFRREFGPSYYLRCILHFYNHFMLYTLIYY